MKSKHTKMGEDYCPNCNHLLDAATGVTKDVKPKPGDVSVCLYCGDLLQYSDDMAVQKLPVAEFLQLPEAIRTDLIRAQTAILYAKIQRQ